VQAPIYAVHAPLVTISGGDNSAVRPKEIDGILLTIKRRSPLNDRYIIRPLYKCIASTNRPSQSGSKILYEARH
jgi:hypothetical protein